ncbi:hypothetical protein chiPu_0019925 [Chiloscyllium punctatum]|uniref:Uncharacterized protein n=1 Tax=Chiloscyllium punctatum TaxID=137246 RepID=A0A401RTH5_CHIPU|nr:hypothetical protein [Chiloscyllium punctatum]
MENCISRDGEQSGKQQGTDAHCGFKYLCSRGIRGHFEDRTEIHGTGADDDEEVSATKENHSRLGEDYLDDTLEYLLDEVEIPHIVSPGDNNKFSQS